MFISIPRIFYCITIHVMNFPFWNASCTNPILFQTLSEKWSDVCSEHFKYFLDSYRISNTFQYKDIDINIWIIISLVFGTIILVYQSKYIPLFLIFCLKDINWVIKSVFVTTSRHLRSHEMTFWSPLSNY